MLNFRWSRQTRDAGGTVVASYHSKKEAKKTEIVVGTGEPVTRIKTWFRSEEEARAAAQAEASRRKRAEKGLTVSLVGNASIRAESPVIAAGLHKDVDGEYVCKSVRHSFGGEGFQTDVSLELPQG